MEMRILLRLLGLTVVSLLVSVLAVGLTRPPAASAATRGTGSLAADQFYSCAVKGGRAYCWGSGTNSDVPIAVDTSGVLAGKTLTQIATAQGATCVLDSSGKAYCWGDNSHGELGDGSFTSSDSAVAVDTSGALAGKTLTQISGDGFLMCALDSAGAAYCWGDNQYGQLGNGNEGPIADSNVPVTVDTSGVLAGKTLTQISVGDWGVCALDSVGAVYCWGQNAYGMFSNNTFNGSDVPVAADTAGALAGVAITQIAVGPLHMCALDNTGAAYCVGYNGYGELGDGNTTNSQVMTAVDTSGALAGHSLAQIAVGDQGTCAVSDAGAAYCWGDNNVGQLGNGSNVEGSDVPVAVDTSGVLAGVTLTQATVGFDHTCAEDAAGVAYCWGDNGNGELGDGNTTSSSVPVRVGPPPPTSVQAIPGNGLAAVSWTASAGVPSGVLTGYTATASPGGESCTTSTATACTITGLSNGSTYSISVVAHTAAYDSGPSILVSVIPESGPSPSTTSITSTTSSPVVGQPITTHVTVAGQYPGSGEPAPTGAVTVSDGTQSCQATLSGSGGVASGSCQLTESSAGTYSFRASYPGDSNFTSSQTPAPSTVTVAHATSTTSITSTTASPVAGQPVTVAIKVDGEFTGSGDPAPGGAVTVHGGAQSCQATLTGSNGVATGSCQVIEPALGSYSLTASYPGDKAFDSSRAPAGRLTVSRARSHTTLQLSTGSVGYGNENSVLVKVTVAPQFTGTPSGKVRITAGPTLCTVQLSRGTGTCSLASPAVLGVGKAVLTASYAGDLEFNSSAAEATLTVRRATSRTTLTLSPTSVKYGNEKSVKITIAVAPQFTGTPRGNVIVKAGKATLCTVRLASATHTCSLPSERALSPGRHVLVASYQGSADFAPSSAAKTLTVDKAWYPAAMFCGTGHPAVRCR